MHKEGDEAVKTAQEQQNELSQQAEALKTEREQVEERESQLASVRP